MVEFFDDVLAQAAFKIGFSKKLVYLLILYFTESQYTCVRNYTF